MDKLKEILRTIVYGQLIVEGKEGTFVRCPLWLVVIAALAGHRALRFAVLTAVLIVAFGMQVRVEGRA